MKRRTFSVTWSLCALVVLAVALLAPDARAQSTAFTFQGQLKSGAAPAQGLHDFRFRLFDDLTAGTQLGATQCADNVPVADGVFTTTIDFGVQFTTTGPRFIEIDVRPDAGLGCGNSAGFTTLGPRQPVTAAPTATHARSAFSLDSPDGAHPNSVFVASGGSVGIGTSNPQFNLWIDNNDADANTDVIIDSGRTSQFFSSLSFFDRGTNKWSIGKEGAGKFFIAEAGFQSRMTIAPGGRVGINTVSPLSEIDVRGDASFGDTGAFKIAHDGRVTMGNIGNLSQITIGAQDAIAARAFQPFITLSDTTNGSLTLSTRIQSVGGGISFQSSNFLAGITNEFMFMDAAGRLGINTISNGPTLDVAGTIRCTTLTQTSSAAFKDDIAPLSSGLADLMRLRPVSYIWNEKAPPISRGKHDLGFIAEEVQEVLPDAVAKDDSGAHIGIDYSRITVLAVKAIKDQQSCLDADREEIRSLRDRLAKLEAAVSKKP
jgi:Chaperone of endosialidase